MYVLCEVVLYEYVCVSVGCVVHELMIQPPWCMFPLFS